MTLEELYEQTDAKDHVNIHLSGDRVFVKREGQETAEEYLIVAPETLELWRIR